MNHAEPAAGAPVLAQALAQPAFLSPEETRATFVIVPAFNEAQVIRATVEGVLALGVHVIVVDDCSTDGSAEQLRGLPVTVLRHSVNLGQGAAIRTGIEAALQRGAAWLVTFDADGQHDALDIVRLVRALVDRRLDVVLGSRFLGSTVGIAASRKLLLRAAVIYTRASTGLALTDAHNGLRAFRAQAAPTLRPTQNRMAHASEMLQKIADAKLAWSEVPVVVRYSEYSRRKGQKALAAVDILFELTFGRLMR